MGFRNTADGWGWPARLLHWSMAFLIFWQLAVGFYMVEIVGNDLIQRFQLTQSHKSWGTLVFALALVRVLWRAANPSPAAPSATSPVMRHVAATGHALLYGLMIALPLTGWLMASASPLNDANAYPMQVRNMVFGLFELPDPIDPGDRDLEGWLAALHRYSALALALVLAGHIGAAVKHHLLDRDRVLSRMVTGR
ncbi:MAG: cytochrome b [Pseudomonadota bacterium]